MSPILTDEIVTYKGKIFQLQNDSLMLLFSEKEVKNRFQQKVAWLERISNVQLTSVNSSDSFDVLKPNDIFLFLDAEEKISMGGRLYKVYKILKEEKVCFLIFTPGHKPFDFYFLEIKD